ncbi:hypothetical protein COY27_04470 [Candidatus Woesearchaeota archaeon CG_4_10_14_0_2_um_filter_33_13]|nr:MAG: hypothetical protein COY27_04470 [Candidatus Woesearchaeota archaeon CG_4_10_14_0_2_um_filter_33_13]
MGEWNLKAQGAIEFITLIGVFLVAFALIISALGVSTSRINSEKKDLIGEDIVNKVQKEVQLAHQVNWGYFREFSLPEKLGGKDYEISIEQNRVIVTIEGEDYWRTLQPVQGEIQKGVNVIEKREDGVYING